MGDSLQDLYRRGLDAVEGLDLEAARDLLVRSRALADENAVEVLHLEGVLAWAEGDHEHAAGFLMQAADAGPSSAAVYLDCAELELELGELDEAEAALRVMLELPDLPPVEADEGRVLLAQVRRLEDDPEAALALLEQVRSEVREHPYFHSARATVLLELDRADEALAALDLAIRREPDDADLHWELGLCAAAAGDEARARAAMLRTWELDLAEREPAPADPAAEAQLRSALEEVLEDLPETLLQLVAGVPISVQGAATRAQVQAGADPRNALVFEGRAASEDTDGSLERIVVCRDVLLDQVDDDEDLPDAFFQGLMVELRRFFRLEQLSFADARA